MTAGSAKIPAAQYPEVSDSLSNLPPLPRTPDAVDVLLVNPPAPDGAIWIRSQHRVGRRSKEGSVYPQVDLAQMASLLMPDCRVAIIDAIAERLSWPQFEGRVRRLSPRHYVTQVTAPTLHNDMAGCFLARSLGAHTIAFGTHVTPMTRQTMEPYPALEFVLRGEPELTLCELVAALEGREPGKQATLLIRAADPEWQPSGGDERLASIKGLAWRRGSQIVVNADRPFIPNLDALPLPAHEMLPIQRYRIPMVKGPYTFVVTSRGCPAGCRFCIKHVSYQHAVRVRSPENIMRELWALHRLGIDNIHMYADLFTVSREQVMGLCRLIHGQDLRIRWTCNSRVDFVDEELLMMMGRAGCWTISWGIESGSPEILSRVRKGYRPEDVEQALRWARAAGIMNWGYFIIGLPGETEETIRQTINLAKRLPLDLALFHIAAPHPGTPFFFEVVEQGWFRPGTRWEEVDMDASTVLDYPGMTAEQLEKAAQRAAREWSLRPGPMWTFARELRNPSTVGELMRIGVRYLGWIGGRQA